MPEIKPNAALAHAVLDQIDAHPETWNQKRWECGTSYCFGGWAIVLSGGTLTTDPMSRLATVTAAPDDDLVGRFADDAALCVLGLEDGQDTAEIDGRRTWLFDAYNSREDLGRLVAEIFGPRPEPVADYDPRDRTHGAEFESYDVDDAPPNAGSAS